MDFWRVLKIEMIDDGVEIGWSDGGLDEKVIVNDYFYYRFCFIFKVWI